MEHRCPRLMTSMVYNGSIGIDMYPRCFDDIVDHWSVLVSTTRGQTSPFSRRELRFHARMDLHQLYKYRPVRSIHNQRLCTVFIRSTVAVLLCNGHRPEAEDDNDHIWKRIVTTRNTQMFCFLNGCQLSSKSHPNTNTLNDIISTCQL